MKKSVRILLALAIGFAVAMLLMTVAIFFGYTKAYNTGEAAAVVKILGIPIYELTKSGSEYIGQSKGIFMGAFCGICMAVAVAAEQLIGKIKKVSRPCLWP